ncbi:MAG: zinc ribbon domain-containing protein [Candidatus Omnitrophota bacterium]|nr:zinc ribbon domain-containing protein [Candidatus Omnitrophota bacterium]
MPTYDYECSSCGHTFEASQKMSDKHLEECPKCKHKVKRLISSGAGIIFKGSGFYATDYRKQAKKVPAKPGGSCPHSNKDGCGGCPHVG